MEEAYTPVYSDVIHVPSSVKSVIHIGANDGIERTAYAQMDLRVVWVEALPGLYSQLVANLEDFPRQSAFCSLLLGRESSNVPFYISNMNGKASSALKINDSRFSVEMQGEILLRSETLDAFILRNELALEKPAMIVLDTQGTELDILRSGQKALGEVDYIKVEVSDFAGYQGCASFHDLDEFMMQNDFSPIKPVMIFPLDNFTPDRVLHTPSVLPLRIRDLLGKCGIKTLDFPSSKVREDEGNYFDILYARSGVSKEFVSIKGR